MSLTPPFPCESTPPPPEEPPVPVSATWNLDLDRLMVVFDKPLIDQPLTRSNWVLQTLLSLFEPIDAMVVLPDAVDLKFDGPVGGDAQTIEYTAVTPDVVGQPPPPGGLNVVPFLWPLV